MVICFTLLFAVSACCYCFSQSSFVDVGESNGIEFVTIFETGDFHATQGGVAWFDYDADGDEDVFLTGGIGSDALFQNTSGIFTNVTGQVGLAVLDTSVNTTGVVAGDINNDGYKDLFVTTSVGGNFLFLNLGNGSFLDISTSAGILQDVANSNSACFGDYNRDGFLDLYVSNWCSEFFVTDGIIDSLTTQKNFFYLNNGNLTFSEVSTSLGIDDSEGCGLACSFTDYDNDGDLDLFVLNDLGGFLGASGNTIYENRFPLDTFYNVGATTGFNANIFSMGLAIGDYNEDSYLDYFVTDIGGDHLYAFDGATFSDVSSQTGFGLDYVQCSNQSQVGSYGWGCGFLDFDNDSYLDLFVAKGDLAWQYPRPCSDNSRLYRNSNGLGQFVEIALQSGIDEPYMSRGTAFSDFDQDGDLDILLCVSDTIQGNHNVRLYQNNIGIQSGNWLSLSLEGVLSPRDAFGAKVEFIFGNRKLMREVDGGSSFNSHHSSTVHVGLGAVQIVDTMRVRWTSGMIDEFYNVSANQFLNVIEGESDVVTQASVFREISSSVSVYPNPVNGQSGFMVCADQELSGSDELVLRDLQGRVIDRRSCEPDKAISTDCRYLDLPTFVSKGVYIITLETNSRVTMFERLIVN